MVSMYCGQISALAPIHFMLVDGFVVMKRFLDSISSVYGKWL